MPETKEKYSIIIINTNGLLHTIKCIDSIFLYTKNFELIIVDNCSDDGSPEYLDSLIKKHKNIKLITTEKRYTFSENNNSAIPLANGDFIIFLNNDTIVSPNWLERMESHFENVPLDNIGGVGPVCNSSNGRQVVPLSDPEEWHQQHRGQWSATGVLYGWCMMFKREVIDKIGGFDEQFINGHEDNDLSLRAVLAGYKLVIAIDTYIYHEGQATLRKIMKDKEEYLEKGFINREAYFNKYYDYQNKHKKLVAVYRTNGGRYLEESLSQTSKFVDSIIIHFCRAANKFYHNDYKMSKDYLGEWMGRNQYENYLRIKFKKIVKIGWYDGIFQEDYERNWLLQEALAMQVEDNADWCISIDDDEIYENKFIGKVQALMNPRNPETLAYSMTWRTIWKTELGVEYYRADDTFGQFMNHRMFKLIPGQEIKSFNHPEGHHCGSAPLFSPENIRWTNIRVRHLGYDTPEQRQRKFEFYQKNDNFKTKADIGHDDYSHLIDQNVQCQVYDPNHSISFVTMVKNEEKMIRGFLEHVQDLVDEYVIVDTGSTDKTLEIINDFAKYCPVPVRVFHYPWEDNYSTPRNFGREQAKGKWILRMDADERFMSEDVLRIFSLTEQDTEFIIFHVINFMEEEIHGKTAKYASTESIRLYRNTPEVYYSGLVHETLEDCMRVIGRKRKYKKSVAPFYLRHYGYLKPKNNIREKLDRYEMINNRQIEITDGTDPRPFFNMALHYLNDERMNDAIKMFHKSIEIDRNFWLAYQQMAALNIKSAKTFLSDTLFTMPQGHPFRNEANEILEFLNKRSVGYVKVT